MNAVEILKQHEVKKTPARMAMINALQSNKYPMSENEIKEQMADLYDRITFYRNVQTLVSAGIIHKIDRSLGAGRHGCVGVFHLPQLDAGTGGILLSQKLHPFGMLFHRLPP